MKFKKIRLLVPVIFMATSSLVPSSLPCIPSGCVSTLCSHITDSSCFSSLNQMSRFLSRNFLDHGRETLRWYPVILASWCSCLFVIPSALVQAVPLTCFWAVEFGKSNGMSLPWLLYIIWDLVLADWGEKFSWWFWSIKLSCCEKTTWLGTKGGM